MFNMPVSSPEIKSWPRDCYFSIFPRVPRYFQTTAKLLPTNIQQRLPSHNLTSYVTNTNRH